MVHPLYQAQRDTDVPEGRRREKELGRYVYHLRDGQDLTCEMIGNYLCDPRPFAASLLVEDVAARGFTGSSVQQMCNRSGRNGPNDDRSAS